MQLDFANSLELLQRAAADNLYHNLLLQLKKDFALANIEFEFANEIKPEALKKLLQEKVYVLLLEKFTEYLNLLYIVDVPEKEMKSIESDDVVEIAAQVSFLILKREWQKVWWKQQYSS